MIRQCWFILLALFLSVSVVHAKDESLYKIIEQEDLDAFSDMVVLGYSVDEIGEDGQTPLIIASALGKKNFVQFLILNEAIVNKRGADGTVALHHAAQSGYVDIIDFLSKSGGYINFPDYEGYTPLMYAVLGNHQEAVQKILDLGADINFINAKKETALSIAQRKRLLPIVTLLEEKGAK